MGYLTKGKGPFQELDLVEKWMLTRLNETIQLVEEDVKKYRLNEALTRIYTLFWGDYCDWYLELIKPPYGTPMDEDTIALAIELYEKMILLLHPFMPFITEELWWKLRPREEGTACMAQEWPIHNESDMDENAASVLTLMQELISGIRNVKSQYGVAPGKEITAILNVPEHSNGLVNAMNNNKHYFSKLAKVSELHVGVGQKKPKASASVIHGEHEVYIPLAGMIDLEVEKKRLLKEIANKKNFLESVSRKLQNDKFVQNAPPAVVDKEREKAQKAELELRHLEVNLADLE